jgi:hypothetical protein
MIASQLVLMDSLSPSDCALLGSLKSELKQKDEM